MQKRTAVYILAAMKFTHIMDVMIMMPLSDIFIKTFNIGASEFSYLVSAYAVGAFLSSLAGVFLLDKFPRKKALLFIYTGFIIGTFLCSIAWDYYSLLAFRFVTGIFGGVIAALALSIVSDLYGFKERGKAIGILMAAFSAAAALGVPAGLYFSTLFSWHFPFIFLACLGFLLLILAWRYMPEIDHLSEQSITPPRKLLSLVAKDLNQINALALGWILVLGHFIIIPFITPYMIRNVGFLDYEISYIYLAGGILTIFTGPLIGRITDKFGALKTFFVVVLLSFVPVILITHVGRLPLSWALCITSAFFILGSGRMIAPNTMITAAVGPETRGSFMSIKSALQQLAVALASYISGAIVFINESTNKVENYPIVGYLSIILCIFAMMIAPKLKVAKGN